MALYYTLEVNPTKSVKLKMNTRNIIALEKSLGGKNVLSIFKNMDMSTGMGDLPTESDISKVLHYSLQSLEHGYDYDKTLDLMDEFKENDGVHKRTYLDLIPLLLEVFQVSGIIPENSNEADPNKVEEVTKQENPIQVVKDL